LIILCRFAYLRCSSIARFEIVLKLGLIRVFSLRNLTKEQFQLVLFVGAKKTSLNNEMSF